MPPQLEACLGTEGLQALKGSGACREHMAHVASREYHIGCNWKVFCDNYLVGGTTSWWGVEVWIGYEERLLGRAAPRAHWTWVGELAEA